MVDIPADMETGNGIRRDIAQLHGRNMNLLFRLRRRPGQVIVMPPDRTDGRYIFYIISRVTWKHDLDLLAFRTGLETVSRLVDKHRVTGLNTVHVQEKGKVTGVEIAQTVKRAFKHHRNFHMDLCYD